jgi:Fe-S oxidoreductases
MSSSIRGPSLPGVGEHRRDREAGRLVYPVVSRRSGGLSLGVNLFPDAKDCSFDCPYCEVFPLREGLPAFSLEELEAELLAFLERDREDEWAGFQIRDICLSGNGEPTLSPHLPAVLELLARIRRNNSELLGSSKLVLITNSTGFLDPATAALLARYANEEALELWAKLDGGSQALFGLMSGTDIDLERIARALVDFGRRAPLVIQTMLCEALGHLPSDADMGEYVDLLCRLTREGAAVKEVQLYTFARPTPGGLCAPIPDAELLRYAAYVRSRTGLAVRAFGERGALEAVGPGGASS